MPTCVVTRDFRNSRLKEEEEVEEVEEKEEEEGETDSLTAMLRRGAPHP